MIKTYLFAISYVILFVFLFQTSLKAEECTMMYDYGLDKEVCVVDAGSLDYGDEATIQED